MSSPGSALSERVVSDDHRWRPTMSEKWKEAPQALQTALANSPFITPHIFLGDLLISEIFWVEHQPYLLSRGYQLRPRYRPEWIPSWKDHPTPFRTLSKFEDSLTIRNRKTLDAVRIRDGARVLLKRIDTSEGYEINIGQYFGLP
ncbi:hypothetical protein H0H92_002387, partial [Tricholoma furcatifolium]